MTFPATADGCELVGKWTLSDNGTLYDYYFLPEGKISALVDCSSTWDGWRYIPSENAVWIATNSIMGHKQFWWGDVTL